MSWPRSYISWVDKGVGSFLAHAKVYWIYNREKKCDGANKNGQSNDIGNIGYTPQRTKTNKTFNQKMKQKNYKMGNIGPTKTYGWGMYSRCSVLVKYHVLSSTVTCFWFLDFLHQYIYSQSGDKFRPS